MALIAISVTDEQLEAAWALADENYDGNVSAMIRAALTEKYPTFGKARKTNRRRNPVRQTDRESLLKDDGRILVQLAE